MKAEIEVLQPGLFSTVQDNGRRGFLQYGVPLSGAMDSAAYNIANALLENNPGAAALEITQMGPKIKFLAPAQIALSGASLSPSLNDKPLENCREYGIDSGDILSFGRRISGCRTYLAIKGGFQTERILGSRSWYSAVTGVSRIHKGMKIPYLSTQASKTKKYASVKVEDYWTGPELQVYPGPEFDKLSKEEKNLIQKTIFSLDRNSNRMGIQLQEPVENRLEPILTSPVLPGTVQLTPGGRLIILMRDGQTTGGYPRVLQLSEKAINAVGQKVPGEKVQFRFRD